MKIAIIDSSKCEYAQPECIAKELRLLGHDVAFFDASLVPSNYIKICIITDIGPSTSVDHKPLVDGIKSNADLKFIANKDCLLKYFDKKDCYYLPYGVDMDIYSFCSSKKNSEIVFVGHNKPKDFPERDNKLKFLKKIFSRRFKVLEGIFGEDCAKIYSESKIVFNYSIRGEITMRPFEALACKTLLITNDVSYLDELFKDDVHLVVYRSNKELEEKVKYYLDPKNEEERNKIANNGYKEVKKHTYKIRAKFVDKKICEYENRNRKRQSNFKKKN